MDYKVIIKNQEPELEKAIDYLKTEVSSIRTSSASPSLLENLVVEVYGGKYKIQELATISIPEPRSLIIEPWDKQTLNIIEKVIRESDLGLNPVVDGERIRLNFPQLTQERREEFIKVLKKKTEEAHIKIRQARENIWEEIKKAEKGGELREDDKFNAKDDLQKLVDEYNKKVNEMEEKKEKELLSS